MLTANELPLFAHFWRKLQHQETAVFAVYVPVTKTNWVQRNNASAIHIIRKYFLNFHQFNFLSHEELDLRIPSSPQFKKQLKSMIYKSV